MASFVGSQVILEIESKIKGMYNLEGDGFVVVFYLLAPDQIGYKVIDENRKLVNVGSECFATINQFDEISSDYSNFLIQLVEEYCKKQEVNFSSLSPIHKAEMLVKSLNEFYREVAHIPVKLLGIN